MEIFLIIFLIIFITLWSLFNVFWLWYLIDFILCEEDYVTSKNTTRKIVAFINENFKKGTFYDLGSSRGDFVLDIANQCPQLQITGIDDSFLRVSISKLRAVMNNKKVVFKNKDIFKTDISKAELIYIYIPRILLSKLSKKLEKELHAGATVITSRISFPGWIPSRTISKNPKNKKEQDIFIYKFPFKP